MEGDCNVKISDGELMLIAIFQTYAFGSFYEIISGNILLLVSIIVFLKGSSISSKHLYFY